MKIEFEKCPNPDILIIHMDEKRLSASQIRKLKNIEGIASENLNQWKEYRIQIEKGRVFKWTDIEPQIIKALTS